MRINHETISSEAVRQRGGKYTTRKYGLKLSVSVMLGEEHEYCTRCQDQSRTSFQMSGAAEDLPFSAKTHRNGISLWTKGYQEKCETCGWDSVVQAVTFRFWLPSDRPSETFSESQAMKMIAKRSPENAERGYSHEQERPLALEAILEGRILAQFAALDKDIIRANAARQACRLASHYAADARKQAKESCNWESRLAALCAEVEAEQQRVLASELEGLQAACDKHEEEWHPEAIRLATERAASLLRSAMPSGFPRGLGREEPVKAEEVRLPGDHEPSDEDEADSTDE